MPDAIVIGAGVMGSSIAYELQKSGLETLVVDKGDACLLYTSPSPRDRTRSRMPSSA